MALRVVGIFTVLLGISIVALGVIDISESKDIAATMSLDGIFSRSPVTQGEFLVRSRLWAGTVVIAGFVTAISGISVALRRRLGFYGLLFAALLVIGFPLLTRLLLPNQYKFYGPDLVDLSIASMIGLAASLEFMFRRRRTSPN